MLVNGKIKELSIEHLEQVQKLQKKIIDGLLPDEKHFILERSANDFLKALTSEETHMLGVFDGEKLVAQAIFAMPKNGQKRDMPEFAGDIANDEMVIYKAISVDPEYRKSNLMLKMLNFIEAKAEKNGKKTSIIQIAIDNPASWINALKHGMSIRKVDLDPDDGAKVLYLQKDMNNEPVLPEKKGQEFHMSIGHDIHREIPALFHRMQYRIEQGYQGVQLEKAGGVYKMVWSRPNQQAPRQISPKMLHLQNKLGMQTII